MDNARAEFDALKPEPNGMSLVFEECSLLGSFEIMKAVASRVTEKSDVLLLAPVDMEDSGPYEIAEPRVITALETYTPSCEYRSRYKSTNNLLTLLQGYRLHD